MSSIVLQQGVMEGLFTFHNVDYKVRSWSDAQSVLMIEAEQISDGARWAGEFTPRCKSLEHGDLGYGIHMRRFCVVISDIEELTLKTGSARKFAVFVKM